MPALSCNHFPASATAALDDTVSRRLSECRGEFLRFFRRRLDRREDAEDALQDFYLKVIRAARKPDHHDKIDAWLGRILRNTLTDHYRRRAARQRAEVAYRREIEGTVSEIDADQDGLPCCCLHDSLLTLRLDYAEILRRADLDEEPRERIAADLGLTANNLGVRLHRARRALRKKLEDCCPTCRDGGFGDCGCDAARENDGPTPCAGGRNGNAATASVSETAIRPASGSVVGSNPALP